MLSTIDYRRAQTRAVLKLLAEDFPAERNGAIRRFADRLEQFASGDAREPDIGTIANGLYRTVQSARFGGGLRNRCGAVVVALYHFANGDGEYPFLLPARWFAYAKMFREGRGDVDRRDIAAIYEKLEDNLDRLVTLAEVSA